MRVTIAIPTIEGREAILLNCLASVLGQSYTDWQLVLCTTNVNTKCEDRETRNPLNNFLKSIELFGKRVIVLQDQLKQGPGTAVQQIVEQVDTELVLRVDDDVILTPQVLAKLVDTYDQYYPERVRLVSAPANGFGVKPVKYPEYWAPDYVQGRPHLIENGRYEKMNDNFTHHSTVATKAIVEVDFLSGYCLLFDRKLMVNIGYVSADSPRHHKEDWFATLRIKSLGYRLLVRADAVTYHNHYELDESDRFRAEHSKEDHRRFLDFRRTISLPPDRVVGILEYEP